MTWNGPRQNDRVGESGGREEGPAQRFQFNCRPSIPVLSRGRGDVDRTTHSFRCLLILHRFPFFLQLSFFLSISTMATSKLRVLALPHPLILLPASRFTMPVSKEIGETLLSLIEESDALPIVAAIPVTSPLNPANADAPLSEWGTAARVLRLVKPPARNPRQPYLVSLHGLTRVRLIHMSQKKLTPEDLLKMPSHDVEYPPAESVPSKEAVEKFKSSALRLLDRLAKDSIQQSRKEGYNKIAAMLEDITDARTPWMADVLLGSINGEYTDRLCE